MRELLVFIEEKKQEFARLPLFEFMRDPSISPRQKVAWAPYAVPFIMFFGDLNKYVFREEPSSDPIQVIINKHTYEDDHHWLWFLEDCKTLEIDQTIQFTDALRFVWGNETEVPRNLIYQLCKHNSQANLIQKLILIEVIEATGNVMLVVLSEIAKELQETTKKELLYFGEFHLNVETGHTTGSPEIEEILQNLQLPEEKLQETYELVEKVFELFTGYANYLLFHAKKSTQHQVLTAS
ncbi:MAG: hypothetical protein EA343_17050 [Nodularia sp. (in: Bacteria)]|nr:MAG: hypothetical protein EA343_17050 [Nodularia sp. (in: cyanobacteria)]